MDYTTGAFWFSAKGRLNRQPYFFATLLSGVPIQLMANNAPQEYAIYLLPIALFLLYVTFVLGIKRSHDRNKSGWFMLLMLIPFVNLWPLIELTFFKGTDGPNDYGPDPLQPAPPPVTAESSKFSMQ